MTSLAELVARVKNYEPDESEWREKDKRPINLLVSGGRSSTVTASQILHHLRAAALQYGEDRLSFPISSKIGAHSIRAGAATTMFLAGVPAETEESDVPALHPDPDQATDTRSSNEHDDEPRIPENRARRKGKN